CSTCFFLSSSATNINSVSGAVSNKKTPSFTSRKSKFNAFWYSSDRLIFPKFHCPVGSYCKCTSRKNNANCPPALIKKSFQLNLRAKQRQLHPFLIKSCHCTDTSAMRRRSLLYFLFIAFSVNQLKAQEEFIESPSKFITRLHFTQLTGGVILLQGQLIGYPDTLNFILDTGSGGISLDSTTAAYLRLNPVPSDRTIRGIAGIRNVSFVHNQGLKLGTLFIDSLDFHINNYDILTAVYGERIDGIIGYSVLKRFIFKIDYDSSRVEIHSKGSLKYPRGGYLLRPLIATLPIQSARVKDEKTVQARFLYDIGAGLCMMLSSDFVEDSMILHKKRRLYYKEAEGLGGKI